MIHEKAIFTNNKKGEFMNIKYHSVRLPILFICFLFSHSISLNAVEQQKEWTFIVYMAADNDLRGFAAKNIKQMCEIGSNEFINIAVHLDIKISGNKKITRRYYIKKDKFIHMNANDPETQSMDSGDPQTLISCCKWAIEQYPAKHYALIFWNHGSGILDTDRGRILNVIDLFMFNPATNKLDLDRSISPFELLHDRGVCWDDTTGNYLTNQKLDSALKHIYTHFLNNKKFDLIGFDACFMAMLEVCNIVQSYATLMVGSQEVELGAGWDYTKVLAPFATNSITSMELAKRIVTSYYQTYEKITNDYTQSAINLDELPTLEKDLNTISGLLLRGLKNQKYSSVYRAIEKSQSKSNCTHFSEPSYIDLHHFYRNLRANIQQITLYNAQETISFKKDLESALAQGITHLDSIILASTAGHNLRQAKGLSIYFPQYNIHSSYKKTPFATTNAWLIMLKEYLNEQ